MHRGHYRITSYNVCYTKLLRFAAILKEVTDSFLPFAQQKNIAIVTMAEATIALTDRNFLAQIFDNLISNAIKYSPVGSAIIISLSRNPGFIRFEVQDQGQGIEPDEIPSYNFV